jgi:threonyl-tRNA synthetase
MQGVTLTKVSGTYWMGDKTKDLLQRVYGIAFPTVDMLKVCLKGVVEVVYIC